MEDTEELNEAVQFLHSESKLAETYPTFCYILPHTGVIIHFPDPILKTFYILDPQWICESLQQVFHKAGNESVNGRSKTVSLL